MHRRCFVMIDEIARRKAHEILSQWRNGEISNFAMEDRWPVSIVDGCIAAIKDRIWLLYDDGDDSRLNLECLSKPEQDLIERSICFLKSNEEYEYPKFSYETGNLHFWQRWSWAQGSKIEKAIRQFESQIDVSIWPFSSRRNT
jgi:hypothetical protein